MTLAKPRKLKRVVLGLGESPYTKAAEAHLAQMGFDVVLATSPKEARKWVTKFGANAVALAADLGPETGWLSAVKLTRARPGVKVVLVGAVKDATQERFANYAGASGYVAITEGVSKLVKMLAGVDVGSVN